MHQEDPVDAGTRAIASWGIVLILLALAATTLIYKLGPWWGDMETKGMEHSYTFVQTKKELLLKLLADYEALDASVKEKAGETAFVDASERQKKAIIARMRIEAESVPTGELPPSVASFLASH